MYNTQNVKIRSVKAKCNIVVKPFKRVYWEINRKSTLKSKTLDALNKVKVHKKNEQTKYKFKCKNVKSKFLVNIASSLSV